CCATFAVGDALRKILNVVCSLHWTVIQVQEMSTSDSEQHTFDPLECPEVTTVCINSEIMTS
ncbi:15121_t:CDS:2, partial [Gigaspora rosea]